MVTRGISYQTLTLTLGPARHAGSTEAGARYEWACGCVAHEFKANIYEVEWCPDHEHLAQAVPGR
jgi:hypothetical protein